MISRRRLMRLGAGAAVGGAIGLALPSLTALAQGGGYRALVCLFLHGGNDGNNTIVPMASDAYDAYQRGRGLLALRQSSLLSITTPSGIAYGLHPQLTDLQRLFNERRLAVIANVGTLVRPTTRDEYQTRSAPLPRNLYSHSDQQRAWQTGLPNGSASTGWGGRTADVLSGGGAATFPALLSVAGQAAFGTGVVSTPATVTPGTAPGLAGVYGDAASLARVQAVESLLTLRDGSVLMSAANVTMREGLRQADTLNRALSSRSAPTTRFPSTGLGQQLAEIARVMNVRDELGLTRQVFFCSLGGFDTHFNQLINHASLMAELGKALAAFDDATREMGLAESVTTFTLSEFGRTLQPTTLLGTDHAWGSHQLVMGGGVHGGDVYGDFPVVALAGPDDVGSRGVWLPTSSLEQYGATLATWLGVSRSSLPDVFPNLGNFHTDNLGFLSA